MKMSHDLNTETIITENKGILSLLEWLKDKEFVAFDTETSGVSSTSEIIGYSVASSNNTTGEIEAFYVITSYWDVEAQELKYFETKNSAPEVMLALKGKQLVMHNAVFDCGMVERNYKVSLIESVYCDTMILAQLVNENRRVGLKDLGAEFYGETARDEQNAVRASVLKNGGQLTKTNYELYKADAGVLALYGRRDAILTLRLFYDLLPQLEEEGMWDFFFHDESMPLLRGPTYQLNTTGLKVDVEGLEKLKKELEIEAIELAAFIDHEITPLVATKYPGTNKRNTFNIGSREQLAWLLYERLGQTFPKVSDAGADLCKALGMRRPYNAAEKREFIDTVKSRKGEVWREKATYNPKTKKYQGEAKVKDFWVYLSTDKTVLGQFGKKYKWAEKLLQLKKIEKLLGNYVEGIQSRLEYGIIRPSFLQHGTSSGRFSCIAEGQIISMPGGDKPIEQVKVGDLVYCFTEEGTPAVSKVLNTFDNGVQDCISVGWRSQGSHKTEELICTPDHRLKTRDNRWVEAGNLKPDDRIYHLRRAVNPVNSRARVYGPNYFMKNEEQLIKEAWFKATPEDHVHHLNGDKSDNRVENLEVLSGTEHTRLHSYELWESGRGRWEHLKNYPRVMPKLTEHPMWMPTTKFQLLRRLAKGRGRSTYVGMDFSTFKRKAAMLGVDLKAVKARYNARGDYLCRGFVKRIIEHARHQKEAIARVAVSHYRFRELVRFYGLESNHKVTGISWVGPRRVFDLEVERHHNFVASELCVHNCKNPNFQNLPRGDKRIKHIIVSRPGKVFVGADMQALEPRVFASYSQDERLMKCFELGQDFYSVTGTETFEKKDCSLYKKDPEFFGTKYEDLRHKSKTVTLSATYGTTAFNMGPLLGLDADAAQDVIDRYFAKFPMVYEMMLEAHTLVKKQGYVENMFGRKRRIPEAMELEGTFGNLPHAELPYQARTLLNLAVNHRIQSTGASIMNRAAIALCDMMKAMEADDSTWSECKIVLQVHDSLILEVPEHLAEMSAVLLKDAMENTVQLPGVKLQADPVISTRYSDQK